MGVLSECAVVYYLVHIIDKAGGMLSNRSSLVEADKLYRGVRAENIECGISIDEIKRMDIGGQVIAGQIFDDIKLGNNDIGKLIFDIEMVSLLGTGYTKADLIVRVSLKNKFVDIINASIKVYKTYSVNLHNATIIGWLKLLFFDKVDGKYNVPKSGADFIEFFKGEIGQAALLNKIYRYHNFIADKVKSGVSKNDARAMSNDIKPKALDAMIKLFNSLYDKDRKNINNRIISSLGFHSDDIYVAIGLKSGVNKVISSRDNKEFSSIINRINNDNISIKMTREINQNTLLNLNIYGNDMTELLSAKMAYTSSGGKYPRGKINAFVNLNSYTKDINEHIEYNNLIL